MPSRVIHLRGGGTSFVLDPISSEGPLAIHYIGPDLGEKPDLSSFSSAYPIERWGARVDNPDFSPPTTFVLDVGLADEPGILQLGSDTPTLAVQVPSFLTTAFTVDGDWGNEFRLSGTELRRGLHYEARRGRHAHDRYPVLILGSPNTTETQGRVLALVLPWSGDFEIVAEPLRSGGTRIDCTTTNQRVSTKNAKAQLFLVYSDQGLNGVSRKLHHFCPAPRNRSLRRVHLNTWEAIYFNHSELALKELSTKAAALGVERFVLDDGWFKGRKSDQSALGDWQPDPQKYPHGLSPLIDHVASSGMDFGLWVEPEMVNPDSDLHRAHPDWVFRPHGRLPPLQRHQLSLDLTKPEVTNYLFTLLDKLLSENRISYLKWDMNRDLTEETAPDPKTSIYVRELYALIDRLREKHPHVEIETCASGGGRCDYGILQRTDRVWVSDNNDALDRLRINRGASLFLPLRIMGTHIGPEVCHTTGRRLSLDLRAHVAMFGHFGLELDIRELSEKEAERLKAHIDNYKRFRTLIHEGHYWRIESHDPDHLIDAVTREDRREAILRVVRVDSKRLGQGTTAFIPGLDPEKDYNLAVVLPVLQSVESCLAPALREGTLRLTGRMLAAAGLSLYLPRPETSLLVHFKA